MVSTSAQKDQQMPSFIKLSLYLIWLNLITTSIVESQSSLYNICSNSTRNYTSGSEYQSNLESLLLNLSASASSNPLFYKASVGVNSDDVYGLYLCRGDVRPQDCTRCVIKASYDILRDCPMGKDMVIWYDFCLLRYSDLPLSSNSYQDDMVCMQNTQNITGNQTRFMELVETTLTEVSVTAAASEKKFAAKDVNYTSNSSEKVYTMAQCTPDMSFSDCQECLQFAIGLISACSENKRGGRVLTTTCNFRYEIYPFYDPQILPPAQPPQILSPAQPPQMFSPPSMLSPRKGSDSRKIIIISTVVSSIAVLLLLFGCSIYFLRRRKNLNTGFRETSQEIHLMGSRRSRIGDRIHYFGGIEEEIPVESQDFPSIPFDIVIEATQDFSAANKLGEGGFGPVYKGILADGKEIAVKRLSRNSGQGVTELMNEVTLIARLQHKNLVRLVGCCLEKSEKLLIYEYMPNKSLDLFLFDSSKAMQLDWQRRLNIIHGIARGLMYLHEDSRLKIIHRDLKVSNVLLDYEMNPKISDFGMARIFGGDQNKAITNRVVGTYGYMAPEYAMEGLFSTKSDVFSFGVIVLEIIRGQRNSGYYQSEHGETLLSYAWKMWSNGQGMQLMDPSLTRSSVAAEVLKCVHIGLLCVQDDPADRPTMSYVVVMFGSDTITLPRPSQSTFSVGRAVPVPSSSSSDKICSVNEVTLSNISPR